MKNTNEEIIRWLSEIGRKYVENILSIVNIERLKLDKAYANKMFFFYWAYERQGAPAGYKIAAIKAFQTVQDSDYTSEYKKYYKEKTNDNINPFLDIKISSLDIPRIVKKIENYRFEEAFKDLKLNGIGHKIRAFFIRDIAYLLNLETKEIEFEDYLFMNPIDIWIQLTFNYLNISKPDISLYNRKKYDLSKENFNIAVALTDICLRAKASPLLANMGIWYYASHYVANNLRLKELLCKKSIQILENEMNLLAGFQDIKRVIN